MAAMTGPPVNFPSAMQCAGEVLYTDNTRA
jgi:hypothetical protein